MEEKLIKQLENLPKHINEAGFKYADCKADSDLLEENKKTLLAALKCKYDGSEAARERLALASDEYQIHIDGMVEAQKETLKARVRYESLIRQHESLRTQISIEKAKINLL